RVRQTEWRVEYVPVAATTVARSPTASIAARIRSFRSLSESVGLSPVVPTTTSPSEPLSTRNTARRWKASKSIFASSSNGVAMAVRTAPSIWWILCARSHDTDNPGSDVLVRDAFEERRLVRPPRQGDERCRRETRDQTGERLDV